MGDKQKMNSLVYGIWVRMCERISHPKKLILVVVSLSIAFYFALMFVCKVSEVNKDILFYQSKSKIEDMFFSDFPSDYHLPIVEGTVTRHSEAYLKKENRPVLKGNLTSLDKHYSNFFRMPDISEKGWEEFHKEPNKVLVHQNIARKLHLKTGDSLFINGVEFICLYILSQHDFKDQIVVNESGSDLIGSVQGIKGHLFISKKALVSLPEECKRLKFHPFQEEISNRIRSLKAFKLFLLAFSVIFIAISLLNVYLVIYTGIHAEKRNYIIKKALGEMMSGFFISFILDTTIVCLVAYHFSLILYFLLIPSVPTFFYYQITGREYFICGVFIVFTSIVLSVILCFQQVKTSYDILRY